MKEYKLEIEKSTRVDDKTGRLILVMRPVLRTDVTAVGQLQFAPWEAWASDTIADKEWCERRALENAREVIRQIAAQV